MCQPSWQKSLDDKYVVSHSYEGVLSFYPVAMHNAREDLKFEELLLISLSVLELRT